MRHTIELAEIYKQLDKVESDIDYDVIRKDKATKSIILLRLIIAKIFKDLEAL